MKPAVITQARMTSTRLPGKVLEEAAGVTMLEHHLARLTAAGLPVIVATTTNLDDDPVATLADKLGAGVVRGSEHDVLSRFALAVREFRPDVVVRVTSDCPLIDGEVVRRGIDAWAAADEPALYASNALERTYPRGLDFEVFAAAALLEADRLAIEQPHREHVTPWLYGDDARPKLNLPWERDASAYRITLDTAEDLRLLRILIEEHGAHHLDTPGLVSLLEAHPELVAINAEIEQKKLGQ
ncbi:glycosyltransferase family protein [Nocardioides sp. NPDC006273]|uniref:glycosyltransferase family protein n=1 Tax=Nocardioides sp. NPDC006273 TaxID=3155598 RepID=UPI0033BC37EA